jgi:hypothetical protein
MLEDAKAVVDVMLGAIALTAQSRTLEEYVEDMQERGQGEERIAQAATVGDPGLMEPCGETGTEVRAALAALAAADPEPLAAPDGALATHPAE